MRKSLVGASCIHTGRQRFSGAPPRSCNRTPALDARARRRKRPSVLPRISSSSSHCADVCMHACMHALQLQPLCRGVRGAVRGLCAWVMCVGYVHVHVKYACACACAAWKRCTPDATRDPTHSASPPQCGRGWLPRPSDRPLPRAT